MSFNQFNLDPRLLPGIRAAGYDVPTPIQVAAIPPALAGRDLIGTAQTGTGKTAAFVLPILQRLLTGPRGRTRALIITPTRELAEQIHEVIRALGAQTKLRSATIYGGVGMAPQLHALHDGVEILVDLKGYTVHARPEIMALRPAPVQVNYLGYPGTMGADFIDYIVGDRFVTPVARAGEFSENLVIMPDSYQVNDRRRLIAGTPSRQALGLPENGFVFCCFNQTYKILPEASPRRFCAAHRFHSSSHSTLPGTASSIRIQSAKTSGRIL